MSAGQVGGSRVGKALEGRLGLHGGGVGGPIPTKAKET